MPVNQENLILKGLRKIPPWKLTWEELTGLEWKTTDAIRPEEIDPKIDPLIDAVLGLPTQEKTHKIGG